MRAQCHRDWQKGTWADFKSGPCSDLAPTRFKVHGFLLLEPVERKRPPRIGSHFHGDLRSQAPLRRLRGFLPEGRPVGARLAKWGSTSFRWSPGSQKEMVETLGGSCFKPIANGLPSHFPCWILQKWHFEWTPPLTGLVFDQRWPAFSTPPGWPCFKPVGRVSSTSLCGPGCFGTKMPAFSTPL